MNIWFRHIFIHGICCPSDEFTKKCIRKRDSLALNSLGLDKISFCLSLIAQSGEAQELVWFSSLLWDWCMQWYMFPLQLLFSLHGYEAAHPITPHFDKCAGSTKEICCAFRSQGAPKLSLEGSSEGLLWLATLANHGEKRHVNSRSTYCSIKALPRSVDAWARTNADLAASLSK